MAKYIPLDALEAELERLREVQPHDEFQPKEQNKHDWFAGKLFTIFSLDTFLDTFEVVKEVDLEKELNDYGYHYDYVSLADRKELVNLAKHFFELGIKAQKNEG